MIELLPPLPLPPGQTGPTGQAPVRADFGQWLSGGAGHPQDAQVPSPLPPTFPVAESTVAPLPSPAPEPDVVTPALHATTPPASGVPLPAPPAPLPMTAPAEGDPLSVQCSLAMTNIAGGTVELIASPWRLAAGGRLAQQVEATLALVMADPLSNTTISRLPGRDGPGSAPGESIPVASGTPALVSAGSAATGLPTSALNAQRIALAAAADDGAAARGALQGQAAHWPLRLLRWLNDGDGGKTVWLRDFTLDSAAVSTLIGDVRRFAQAENLPLARIVLNGRTLWTATPSLRDST